MEKGRAAIALAMKHTNIEPVEPGPVALSSKGRIKARRNFKRVERLALTNLYIKVNARVISAASGVCRIKMQQEMREHVMCFWYVKAISKKKFWTDASGKRFVRRRTAGQLRDPKTRHMLTRTSFTSLKTFCLFDCRDTKCSLAQNVYSKAKDSFN